MSFVDRITGESAARLPSERTHFGRWLFAPGDGSGPMRLNGQPAGDGDVPAPDPTGEWTLLRPGDSGPIRGRFFPDALPDEQDVTALLQLGGMLREPEKAKGGWLEWGETSPLAPGLDEMVEPHPLEDCIETGLEHLVAVCRKPRTHIRRETERVRVARARRVARDAPAWLASHTEDWEHRRITGVQPRRILAEIREEQWDLYENRVAVRLVDNLVTWLRRRIAEVRRVLGEVLARMEEFSGSPSGNRHRAARIYRLWGEAWDAGNRRGIAERTLKRLERLLYRVLGLMDSPLYRRISRHAQTPRGLRMTNVFRNHDHYRGVARLWHEWSRAAPRTPSPGEVHKQRQELHRSFDAWCMLVVTRACSQLDLGPSEDEDLESEVRPGGVIRLDKGFRLEWERIGAVTLADEDRVILRFVPVAHVLEQAKTREAMLARVTPFVGAVSGKDHWTIVLHPAISGRPPHDALAGVGNPPAPKTMGAIDFIRVSPFSLDSVERVSRAIRWATLVPRMLAYPPALQTLPDPELDRESWIDKREDRWAVVRMPRPGETSKQEVEKRLVEARARQERLTKERGDIRNQLRQSLGDRRRMGDLNQKRSNLLEKLRNAESDVERWKKFERDFKRACDLVAILSRCPACGEDADFEVREHDCFATSCRSDSCRAQWELRHDPDTQSRIPVFWRRGFEDMIANESLSGPMPRRIDIDDAFGCDLLAVPKVGDDGKVDFLPPRREAAALSGGPPSA